MPPLLQLLLAQSRCGAASLRTAAHCHADCDAATAAQRGRRCRRRRDASDGIGGALRGAARRCAAGGCTARPSSGSSSSRSCRSTRSRCGWYSVVPAAGVASISRANNHPAARAVRLYLHAPHRSRTERVPQPTPFASLHRSRTLTRTTRRAERTRAAPRHAGIRAPASRDEPRWNSELVHEEARSRRPEKGRPAILSGTVPPRVELLKQAEATHRHVTSRWLLLAVRSSVRLQRPA